MLQIEDYIINTEKILGTGSYGKVYLGFKRDGDDVMYAIKETRPKKSDRSQIMNEINTMRQVEHRNIVKFKELIRLNNAFYIIMEYCIGGNLESFIEDKKILSDDQIENFVVDLCSGIYELHKKGIGHRDLKPQNILLSDKSNKPILKIADFGFAKFMGTDLRSSVCGTPIYMAPEANPLTTKKIGYNLSADMWSLGCLIYFIVQREHFMNYKSDIRGFIKELERVEEEGIDYKIESIKNEELKNLLRKLIVYDATKRYTYQELVEDPFVKKCMAKRNFEETQLRTSLMHNQDYLDKLCSSSTSLSLSNLSVSRSTDSNNSFELTAPYNDRFYDKSSPLLSQSQLQVEETKQSYIQEKKQSNVQEIKASKSHERTKSGLPPPIVNFSGSPFENEATSQEDNTHTVDQTQISNQFSNIQNVETFPKYSHPLLKELTFTHCLENCVVLFDLLHLDSIPQSSLHSELKDISHLLNHAWTLGMAGLLYSKSRDVSSALIIFTSSANLFMQCIYNLHRLYQANSQPGENDRLLFMVYYCKQQLEFCLFAANECREQLAGHVEETKTLTQLLYNMMIDWGERGVNHELISNDINSPSRRWHYQLSIQLIDVIFEIQKRPDQVKVNPAVIDELKLLKTMFESRLDKSSDLFDDFNTLYLF